MKVPISAALAIVLATSNAAFAQDKSSPLKSESPAASNRALMVLGKVSSDGKTFLTDIDSEWTVSNADVLKGHEGRMVTVKCYVDTQRNQLQILSVKPAKNEWSYASRQTDSAFRR